MLRDNLPAPSERFLGAEAEKEVRDACLIPFGADPRELRCSSLVFTVGSMSTVWRGPHERHLPSRSACGLSRKDNPSDYDLTARAGLR